MKVSLLHKVRKSFACMTILLLVMVLSSHAQGLLREYWSGVSGTAVSNLTGNANYPNNPTSRNIITTFEGPPIWRTITAPESAGMLFRHQQEATPFGSLRTITQNSGSVPAQIRQLKH
jgi:hypothetical protein